MSLRSLGCQEGETGITPEILQKMKELSDSLSGSS